MSDPKNENAPMPPLDQSSVEIKYASFLDIVSKGQIRSVGSTPSIFIWSISGAALPRTREALCQAWPEVTPWEVGLSLMCNSFPNHLNISFVRS